MPSCRRAMISPLIFLTILLAVAGQNANIEEENKPEDIKYCKCEGSECQCCVDFNITYIDLGGPGCVKMKYLSQEDGITVKVSYGDSQLHEGHVKANNVTATCMDILLELAQMCATFNHLRRTENGLQTCASLEPTLLGDPHDSYHLGCFDMGPNGMKLLNISPPDKHVNEVTSETDKPTGEQESFFEAVNESAEDSIAWFTNFWGINFTKGTANSTNETTN